MKTQKPYADLASQAEKAVSAIKDPELRRVAFERVLDDLLSTADAPVRVGKVAAAQPKRPSARTPEKSRKGRGPKGYVRELAKEGFFKKPKTIAEIKAELSNRGHHIVITSLSGRLQELCRERVLRRHKAKASKKGKKATFNYSEW